MSAEPSSGPVRAPRADAVRNRERLLEVAAEVVAEQGTQASLRDVARRAGVGLGTLYRHFPNREALLEALLHRRFRALAERAAELGAADAAPERALREWLYEFTREAGAYQGLPATLVATLGDVDSPLHADCLAMRAAGGRLLTAAQRAGAVRADVTPLDLYALSNALGWVGGQSEQLAGRRDHLFELLFAGLSAGLSAGRE
ncbi:TetR/AcrR family transcriptional regulator [Kitasatospora sp. NPDC096147]|uniref:TetR/AcrR family transcriptional regulator n=1 Tax=Kitasatospora sp. NPDC096147 TaxID=3364093 RepID=UPI0038074282